MSTEAQPPSVPEDSSAAPVTSRITDALVPQEQAPQTLRASGITDLLPSEGQPATDTSERPEGDPTRSLRASGPGSSRPFRIPLLPGQSDVDTRRLRREESEGGAEPRAGACSCPGCDTGGAPGDTSGTSDAPPTVCTCPDCDAAAGPYATDLPPCGVRGCTCSLNGPAAAPPTPYCPAGEPGCFCAGTPEPAPRRPESVPPAPSRPALSAAVGDAPDDRPVARPAMTPRSPGAEAQDPDVDTRQLRRDAPPAPTRPPREARQDRSGSQPGTTADVPPLPSADPRSTPGGRPSAPPAIPVPPSAPPRPSAVPGATDPRAPLPPERSTPTVPPPTGTPDPLPAATDRTGSSSGGRSARESDARPLVPARSAPVSDEPTARLRAIRESPESHPWGTPAPRHVSYPGSPWPPPETPSERTGGLQPLRVRRPLRTIGALACVVLGLGLIGGAVTGSWLTEDSSADTATDTGFSEARTLWHSVPVDTLFPVKVEGKGAGPGKADRTWSRVAVAPDGNCTAALDPLLVSTLQPVGCARALRATYTDATSSYVTTVGLVFTEGDKTTMKTLKARFGNEDLAKRSDLMPRAFPAPGTVAAGFGDRQRASWTVTVLTQVPVIVYAVSGFADGRPVNAPEPASVARVDRGTTTAAQAGLGHEAGGLADGIEKALVRALSTAAEPPE
ncbi:hypothetical protein [Streptomyces sp. NBC_00690]|uniref:hypothetical protein n=1 Tax=Streptomyces sp. NBC_00690 TaxID=2975808 RepID=UPI002E2A0A48|nr:hypothetical protein [Streptomyces sp. NBC_00690]